MKFIMHGSENSLDKDIYVLVDKEMENQAAKELCLSFVGYNANLIKVDDGIVSWCYKGTVDECNNSILATYHLHNQIIDCPVDRLVEREYGTKLARTIRGLLSYVSRTNLRREVKKALRSNDFEEKLSVIKKINFNEINDFEKSSKIETYKFFAFQLGQTRALLEDGLQLFTKNEVASRYNDLTLYLNRVEYRPSELQNFLNEFIIFVEKRCNKTLLEGQIVCEFNGKKEVFDVKKEKTLPPVVIFDIDGTLMDESHRAHLREKRKFEEYFLACKDDVPIFSTINLLNEHKKNGDEIWIVSGRSIICENETIESLKKNGIYWDQMKLRGKDNFIPDFVIKPAWFKKLIGLERIKVVYDDSPKVIKAIKKLGINVIDVNSNNFRNKTKLPSNS